MFVLMMFAFLAGAATAITPCVLPVLPALLSASATGGRRRPLGIMTGLTLTHTITIIGIASVVDGVGLADGTLRSVAIVVLGLFGVTLLVPAASHWFTARLSFSRAWPHTAPARASGRACPSAARWASSTRPAPDRSSAR